MTEATAVALTRTAHERAHQLRADALKAMLRLIFRRPASGAAFPLAQPCS